MRNCIGFLPIVILFASCVKDKPEKGPDISVSLSGTEKVFITNEGNFGNGNGSVSLYDPGSGSLVEDYYKAQNNAGLGDVVQSMIEINGDYYIVVNNSGKITVCDRKFRRKGEITGLNSPRYMIAVSHARAYVSDIGGGIHIIDLNTRKKTGEIVCSGWTEKMVMIYNKVFVTNLKRHYTYIIDGLSDKIIDSVFTGPFAASIVADKYDRVWVLAGKEFGTDNPGRLSRINPVSHKTDKYWDFNQPAEPFGLAINVSRDTIYYLNAGVCRMAVVAESLPAAPFVGSGNRQFYGIGVSPRDHRIYVSDAIDYNQRSMIYVFDSGGNEKAAFRAGIIAGGFYFE